MFPLDPWTMFEPLRKAFRTDKSPWVAQCSYKGTVLFTADAAICKHITDDWRGFPKPSSKYNAMRLWGENILTAEGKLKLN